MALKLLRENSRTFIRPCTAAESHHLPPTRPRLHAGAQVANVFLSGLALLPAMVDGMAGGGGRDCETLAEAVLPLLVEKLGDNNPKLR